MLFFIFLDAEAGENNEVFTPAPFVGESTYNQDSQKGALKGRVL